MGYHVVIVAGGNGSRMNSATPKQFIELGGKPILMHTIERFIAAIPAIQVVVVLSKSYRKLWDSLCKQHHFTINHALVEAGETRFHSVQNGLALVPENTLVGIHDAARPLVSKQTIITTFEKARELGNASPCLSITESIRMIKDGVNKAVDRNNYVAVQTPQCFHSSLIKKAFLQPYNPLFTDDASVLEANGEKINLIDGNKENIKITTPHDLVIAEVWLKSNF